MALHYGKGGGGEQKGGERKSTVSIPRREEEHEVKARCNEWTNVDTRGVYRREEVG